jgi:hypothetical protein
MLWFALSKVLLPQILRNVLRNCLVINSAAIHFFYLLRFPIAHIKGMRNDPTTGSQLI